MIPYYYHLSNSTIELTTTSYRLNPLPQGCCTATGQSQRMQRCTAPRHNAVRPVVAMASEDGVTGCGEINVRSTAGEQRNGGGWFDS